MKNVIYAFLFGALILGCTANNTSDLTDEISDECGPAFEESDIKMGASIFEDKLEISLSSNLEESIAGRVSVELYDFSGTGLGTDTSTVTLNPDSVFLIEVPLSEINLVNKNSNFLICRFESKDGSQRSQSLVYFSDELTLESDPDIDIDVQPIISGYKVRLISPSLVKNVKLSFPVEGTWSNNCFDLLPSKLGEYYFSIPEYTPDLEDQLEISFDNPVTQ